MRSTDGRVSVFPLFVDFCDLRVTYSTSALQTTADLPVLREGRPCTRSVVTPSSNVFFRHSSVYPFPESPKKRANFHTHQVNSNWAVPQTIESSAKICGSLEILHSHIPPRNSSRFFLLHTWHGTLSGVMTSGKAATAESSCLQAVGCVGCLLGASAEVLSSRISDECQNTGFQIPLSSHRIIFIYRFYPSLCLTEGFGEFVHSVTDVPDVSSPRWTCASASTQMPSWVSHQPPVEIPACGIGLLILRLPWLIGSFMRLLEISQAVILPCKYCTS